MTALDDLRSAVRAYPTDQVSTQIVNFAILGDNGNNLNVGEKFTFRVRVSNQGPLFMQDVKVQVFGTEFAAISDNATSGTFDLPSFTGSHTTVAFTGRATSVTGAVPTDIVTAGIVSWDPDLNNLLRDSSTAGKREGKLTKTIAAD